MKRFAPIKWLLPLLLASALGGCLNTTPVSDSRRFFVIEPGPAANDETAGTDNITMVGLKPIAVPAYLRDNRIVVRESETEIGYSEEVRWGEPLGLGLQRVIGGNIDAALEDVIVIGAPWQRGGVDFNVMIRFHRCEVDTSGLAVVDAEWLCSKVGDSKKPIFGQYLITKRGPSPTEDPAGAVSTLSTTIHELSLQISNTIRTSIDRAKELMP